MTVSSSKLEQDVSLLIDLHIRLGSRYLKFSHITDKVRFFFSGPPAVSYKQQKVLTLIFQKWPLSFDLKFCFPRDRPPSIHFVCISDFAPALEFTPMCMFIRVAAVSL